jgi:hypothetical protein
MTFGWKDLWRALAGGKSQLSIEPPECPIGLPNTFEPPPVKGVQGRPRVFEPALQHYPRAFRLGDPLFGDREAAKAWHAARARAVDHVLRAVARPTHVDHLVLRGSLLLKAWFGEQAREPGDIDWVARPPTLAMDSDAAHALFYGLIETVCGTPCGFGVEIVADAVRVDDIWTYTRVPGRRAVFPWRAPGVPPGVVQFDVVFGEELVDPPVWTSIPTSDGGGVSLWAAGMAQSLAWKLLWLATDSYPQGKDLYDATLLAERTRAPWDLLERTFRATREPISELTPDVFLLNELDWASFAREYPWVPGTAAEWYARLVAAVRPTFAERPAGV